MNQVQVEVTDVRAAAAGADEAAQLLASAHHDELSALSDALPGSLSATAAAELAAQWHQVTERWQQAAGAYSESLQDSADTYQGADQDSAHTHDRLARRLSGLVAQ